MRYFMLCCLLICSLSIFAQSKNATTEKNNIPYREKVKDAYMKERCVLDIQAPASANKLPIIVWFHGGGLTGGDKRIPATLNNQPAIVISANYRFSPKAKVEDIIDDAAAAVAWAFEHASAYGGDTSRIYVAGHSAGGYLLAMIGLDKHYLAKYKIDANRIAALFSFSCQAITHFTWRKEHNISDKQAIVNEFAPLYHARADAPPLYLFTGDRELEMLGRYEENAYLARMMKINGHTKTKLYEFDGFNHNNMPIPAFEIMLQEIFKKK